MGRTLHFFGRTLDFFGAAFRLRSGCVPVFFGVRAERSVPPILKRRTLIDTGGYIAPSDLAASAAMFYFLLADRRAIDLADLLISHPARYRPGRSAHFTPCALSTWPICSFHTLRVITLVILTSHPARYRPGRSAHFTPCA
jgi:hypothetical protein